MLAPIVLIATLAAAQAENPAADLSRQVRDLVDRFESPEVAKRDEAESQIIKLGPTALEHLPRVTARTAPETKQRLVRVRRALELEFAKQAGQPSRITLSGELPLADILAAIAKQSGNKIADGRRGEEKTNPKLKVEFKETPFWQALDEVADLAKLGVETHAADEDGGPAAAVKLVDLVGPAVSRKTLVAYAGPLRVEAAGVIARRELRTPGDGQLKLNLNVAWEPRLAPIAVSSPARDVNVTDDRNKAVAVTNAAAEIETPIVGNAKSIETEVNLVVPPREVKQLTSVKGKLVLLTPGRIETFRFDKLADSMKPRAAAVEQSKGDVSVSIGRIVKNNDLWEVRARVRYGKTESALQSHYAWLYENRAMLDLGGGKTLAPAGFESDSAEDGIEATYYFDGEQDLSKCVFIYNTPLVILNVPIEYELKGIPLP